MRKPTPHLYSALVVPDVNPHSDRVRMVLLADGLEDGQTIAVTIDPDMARRLAKLLTGAADVQHTHNTPIQGG